MKFIAFVFAVSVSSIVGFGCISGTPDTIDTIDTTEDIGIAQQETTRACINATQCTGLAPVCYESYCVGYNPARNIMGHCSLYLLYNGASCYTAGNYGTCTTGVCNQIIIR